MRIKAAFVSLVAWMLALICVTLPAFSLTQSQSRVLFGVAPHFAGATIDLNFANGTYYTAGATGKLTTARASVATNLLPSSPSGASYQTFGIDIARIAPGLGILVEEARTNYLINSSVLTSSGPATQTTGSLGTGTYTLWVNGSGSATMALGTGIGCGTSSATQGSPASFTISVAGTCIVTVAGSLNEFQLELNPGAISFATSFIPTGATPAGRAADFVLLPIKGLSTPSIYAAGVPLAPANYSQYQMLMEVYLSSNRANDYMQLIRVPSTGVIQGWAYNVASFAAVGTTVWPQNTKSRASGFLNGSTMQSTYAGANLASSPFAGAPIFDSLLLNLFNGYMSEVAVSPGSLLNN